MMRISIALAVLCTGLPAYASGGGPTVEGDGTVTVIRAGMIALCVAIAFLTIAVKGTLGGGEVSVGNVVFRLIFVVCAIMAAVHIQDTIAGIGQSLSSGIGDHNHGKLMDELTHRVHKMQVKNTEESDFNPITNPFGFLNLIKDEFLLMIEQFALSVYYFAYSWFQAVYRVLMNFLAFMAPMMIATSIIPGVRGFIHWLQLVVCVALWPAISSFFLQQHFESAITLLGGSYGDMNPLQLLAEAVIYGIFLLATPFISAAVVYGSAQAFAMGAGFLLSAGPLAVATRMFGTLRTGARASGFVARRSFDVATLARHPRRAPVMIYNAARRSLAASAKFQPASPALPKGGDR